MRQLRWKKEGGFAGTGVIQYRNAPEHTAPSRSVSSRALHSKTKLWSSSRFAKSTHDNISYEQGRSPTPAMLTGPISHLGGGARQEIPSQVLGRLKVSMRGLPESSASAFPAATQLLLRHSTDQERRSCVTTERGLGGSGRGALGLSKSTWQRFTRRLRGKPGNKSWGKGKTYPPHTTTSQIHAVNSETL